MGPLDRSLAALGLSLVVLLLVPLPVLLPDPHITLCTRVHQVSSLHYAARQNSLVIMELLLDNGAEVDNLAAGDLTPLHFAAR